MNRSELFNKLNSLRYTTCENYQYSLFEDTPRDCEYWMAGDLEKLFGIENMPWHDDIYNEMYSCMAHATDTPQKTQINLTNHIIPIGSVMAKKTYDMKLSRLAAWSITDKNPRMAFTHAYFMMPGADVATISGMADKFTRINNHNKLAQHNHRIAGMLHRDNIPYFRFYADLHGAFFGTAATDTIKAQNGIRITAHDSIHNYMGAASMGALANGIDAIIYRYNMNGRHNTDTLSYITVQEMTNSRTELAKKTGRTPAMDIEKTHIKDLRADMHNAEYEFIKKFMNEKLR